MSVRSLGVTAKTSASCLCPGSHPFCLGRECLCLVRVMLVVPSVLGKTSASSLSHAPRPVCLVEKTFASCLSHAPRPVCLLEKTFASCLSHAPRPVCLLEKIFKPLSSVNAFCEKMCVMLMNV